MPRRRVILAALLAAVLFLAALTLTMCQTDDQPATAAQAAPVSAEEAQALEDAYRWRSRVCNAKDRGESPSDVCRVLVRQWGLSAESSVEFIQQVWPDC